MQISRRIRSIERAMTKSAPSSLVIVDSHGKSEKQIRDETAGLPKNTIVLLVDGGIPMPGGERWKSMGEIGRGAQARQKRPITPDPHPSRS